MFTNAQQQLGPPVPAVPADAVRIAEIHVAAFSSNAMLLAQFPTPEARKGLQESARVKALADIADPKISVLVVRCCDTSSTSTSASASVPVPVPVAPTSSCSMMQKAGVEEGGSGREDATEKEEERREEAERDSNNGGLVVSFAKWSHPLTKKEVDVEGYKETDWIWHPGTNMGVLNAWGEVMEEAERRFMGDGDTPFYRTYPWKDYCSRP
jgi:ribosomal protein L12E/L44/L45/RPP1/RPP2